MVKKPLKHPLAIMRALIIDFLQNHIGEAIDQREDSSSEKGFCKKSNNTIQGQLLNEVIENIETYGYIILFLYSLGGGFVGLVAAGVLSYLGKLDLMTSMAVAFVANAIGDMLLFYISRFNKDMFDSLIKKQKRVYALSVLLIKKYGNKMVFIQKFIYGVKTFVPIAMGLSRYSGVKFTILNIVAALIWALVIGLGSYFASEVFLEIFSFITDNPYIMPILLVTILGGAYLYLKKIAHKGKKRRKATR